MVIYVGLDITIVQSYSIRRACIPITNTGVPVTHGFTGDIRIFHNTDIPIICTAIVVRCTDIPIMCTAVAVRCTDL